MYGETATNNQQGAINKIGQGVGFGREHRPEPCKSMQSRG